MKYYLHDSNAFSDEKITMLYLKYGYEGLGLFYTALEKLAAQEKPINTEVLKAQLKVGKHLDKVFKYCETLGILCSNNGETFSKQLMNFAEKYRIKNEKNKEKIKQWREKQADTKNVTSYETVRNHSKVKESKVKESKDSMREADEPPAQTPKFNFKKSLLDSGADNHLTDDWLKVRKELKATNTETALSKFLNEVKASGHTINEVLKICCEKSWKGFNHTWKVEWDIPARPTRPEIDMSDPNPKLVKL